MFIVLYRWRLKPGAEEIFRGAWAEVTDLFRREYDSLGSRLHRGNDGVHYAYAQWKSAEDRERAFGQNQSEAAVATMRDCIAESFEPVVLEIIEDFLV